MPLPVPPPPTLRWEILDGASMEPADVIVDETSGLLRSGVIELRLPSRRRPGRPSGFTGKAVCSGCASGLSMGNIRKVRTVVFEIECVCVIAARKLSTKFSSPYRIPMGDDGNRARHRCCPGRWFSRSKIGAGGKRGTLARVAELSIYGAEDHVYELDPRNER